MNYVEKNKEEIYKIIDEILDEKANINFSEFSSDFANHFYNRDEAERIILERSGKTLQDKFNEAIKKDPMVLESISQRLDGKTKEDIAEEERQEEIDKKTEELTQEENLSHEEQEKLKEEAKSKKDVTSDMLKALVVKAVYEHTLEEYNNLREDLYTGVNGQVKTGELTNGEKMDTKLVLYERYIKKLDMQYKGYTGHLITQDDEEIKEKENKCFARNQKNEKIVYAKVEDNLDRVNKLNGELNAIAEEISWRSANAGLMKEEDFEKEMAKLQEMYLDKVVELRMLNPDIVELSRQVEAKEKNDYVRENLVGNEYERQKYKKGVIDSKNGKLDEYTDKQEEKIEDGIHDQNTQMNQSLINSVIEQQKMADSCFAKFETTGDIKDYNEALSHLKMAEQMAGITSSGLEEIDVEENSNEDITKKVEKEEENEEKRKADIESDEKDNMGLDRTANEKMTNLKASYRERATELNEKLNQMNSQAKDKDENSLVRKLN